MNEVVAKVLLNPIRPHFALASIGPCFCLEETLQLVCFPTLLRHVDIYVSVYYFLLDGSDIFPD